MEIRRKVKAHLHSFSAAAVDRSEYSVSHSSHFILSAKAPRTHWIWIWDRCFGQKNLLLLVRIQPQLISSPASNLAVILTMIQNYSSYHIYIQELHLATVFELSVILTINNDHFPMNKLSMYWICSVFFEAETNFSDVLYEENQECLMWRPPPPIP
jgi:hypothetical protein